MLPHKSGASFLGERPRFFVIRAIGAMQGKNLFAGCPWVWPGWPQDMNSYVRDSHE